MNGSFRYAEAPDCFLPLFSETLRRGVVKACFPACCIAAKIDPPDFLRFTSCSDGTRMTPSDSWIAVLRAFEDCRSAVLARRARYDFEGAFPEDTSVILPISDLVLKREEV